MANKWKIALLAAGGLFALLILTAVAPVLFVRGAVRSVLRRLGGAAEIKKEQTADIIPHFQLHPPMSIDFRPTLH